MRWFMGMLVLSGLLSFALTVLGQGGEPDPNAVPPKIIQVSVYINRLEPLEITTGTYTVDFYLTLTCADPPCEEELFDFEIMNGRAISSDITTEEPGEWKEFRVIATMKEDINLRRYPFDSHNLSIKIESPSASAEELVYVADLDTSYVDDDVYVLGWDLNRDWEAHVEDKIYAGWGTVYSRYIFSIPIRKPPLAGLIKGILPAIIIVMGSLFSLLLGYEDGASRLTLNSGLMVASVVFHFNLTATVPKVGYLLYADGLMLINYLVIILSIGVSVGLIMFRNRQQPDQGRRLNLTARFIIPSVWLALQVINAVWLLG